MILILTACIAPQLSENLMVQNVEERLEQYEKAFEFYIQQKNVTGIIFCDNSNYDLNKTKLPYLVSNTNKKVELMSFMGDMEMTKVRGKGYGEGEILKYVLNNSKLLKNEERFAKVTGRLIIENINNILKCSIKKEYEYYNGMGIFGKSDQVDTRFFISSKCKYQNYFIEAYKRVNDSEGMFLERVFMKILLTNKIKVKSTPLYPQYIGQSGTTGKQYEINIASQLSKSIGNRIFDMYNPLWRGKI